jgi:hypothetical protein
MMKGNKRTGKRSERGGRWNSPMELMCDNSKIKREVFNSNNPNSGTHLQKFIHWQTFISLLLDTNNTKFRNSHKI